MNEIDLINDELDKMRDLFSRVVQIIPRFNITSKKVLPYGLKPHTRSVSWIIEQVIIQQTKYNRRQLNIEDVDFDVPDTCLHDCVIIENSDKHYFVNIKTTSAGSKQNKNDISAVEKLFMQYSAKPDYRLIFAVFGFRFDNRTIVFDKEKVHTFSPQFLPIYVNPRNDKIQAYYYAPKQERTRQEFLTLLKQKSRSILL